MCVLLRCFNTYCYASCFWARFYVHTFCSCVKCSLCMCFAFLHLHCSVQLNMSNVEKRYGNKIIVIIVNCCVEMSCCSGVSCTEFLSVSGCSTAPHHRCC